MRFRHSMLLLLLLCVHACDAALRFATEESVDVIPENKQLHDLTPITIAWSSDHVEQQRANLLVTCQHGGVSISPQARPLLKETSFVCFRDENEYGGDIQRRIAVSTTLEEAQTILSSLVYSSPPSDEVCQRIVNQDTLTVQLETVDTMVTTSAALSTLPGVCYDPSSMFTSFAIALEKRIVTPQSGDAFRGPAVRIVASETRSVHADACFPLPPVKLEASGAAAEQSNRVEDAETRQMGSLTMSTHNGSLQLSIETALRNRVRVYGVELEPRLPLQLNATFTLRGVLSDLNAFLATVQYCSYPPGATAKISFASDIIDVNATVTGLCSSGDHDDVVRSYASIPVAIEPATDLGIVTFPENPANAVILSNNKLSMPLNVHYSLGNVEEVAVVVELEQGEDGTLVGIDDPYKLLIPDHYAASGVYMQTITRAIDATKDVHGFQEEALYLQSKHRSWLKKRETAVPVRFTEHELKRAFDVLTGLDTNVRCQQVFDVSPTTVCTIEYNAVHLLQIPRVSFSDPETVPGLSLSGLTEQMRSSDRPAKWCGLHVEFDDDDDDDQGSTFQFTRRLCDLAQDCRVLKSRSFSSEDFEDEKELADSFQKLSIQGENVSHVRVLLQSGAPNAVLISKLPCALAYEVEIVSDAKVTKTRILGQHLQIRGPAQRVAATLRALRVYSLAFGVRAHNSLQMTVRAADASSSAAGSAAAAQNASAKIEVLVLPNLRNIKLSTPRQLVVHENSPHFANLSSVSIALPWEKQLLPPRRGEDQLGARGEERFRWTIQSKKVRLRYENNNPSLADVVHRQRRGTELEMRGSIASFAASMAAISLDVSSDLKRDKSFFTSTTIERQVFQLTSVPRPRKFFVQTLTTSSAQVSIAGTFALGLELADGFCSTTLNASVTGVTCRSTDVRCNDDLDTIAAKVKTMPCALPAHFDTQALYKREIQIVRVNAVFPSHIADVSGGGFKLQFQGAISTQISTGLANSDAMRAKVLEVLPDPQIEVSRIDFPSENAFEWRITFGSTGRVGELIHAFPTSTATATSFTVQTTIAQQGLKASDLTLALFYPSISVRVRDTKLSNSVALSLEFHFWDVAHDFPHLKLIDSSLASATTQTPLKVELRSAEDDASDLHPEKSRDGRFRIHVQGHTTRYVTVSSDAASLEGAIQELEIDNLSVSVQRLPSSRFDGLCNWILEASHPSLLTIAVEDDELESPALQIEVTSESRGVEALVGHDVVAVSVLTADAASLILYREIPVRVVKADVDVAVMLPVSYIAAERNKSVFIDGIVLDGFDVGVTLEVQCLCNSGGQVSLVARGGRTQTTTRDISRFLLAASRTQNASRLMLQGSLSELNAILMSYHLVYVSQNTSSLLDAIHFRLRSATTEAFQVIPVQILAPAEAPVLVLPATHFTVEEEQDFEIRGLKLVANAVDPSQLEDFVQASESINRQVVRVHVHARVGYCTLSSTSGGGFEASQNHWRSTWKHEVRVSGSIASVNAALSRLRYVAIDLTRDTREDDITFTTFAAGEDGAFADSAASKVFRIGVRLTKPPATLQMLYADRMLRDHDQLLTTQDESVSLRNISIRILGNAGDETNDNLQFDLSISAIYGTFAFLNSTKSALDVAELDLRVSPLDLRLTANMSRVNRVLTWLEYVPKRNFNGPDKVMIRVKQAAKTRGSPVVEETTSVLSVFVDAVRRLPRWSWTASGLNITTLRVATAKTQALPAFTIHDAADAGGSVVSFFENEMVLRATVRTTTGTLSHDAVQTQPVNENGRHEGSSVTLEGRVQDLRVTLSQIRYQMSLRPSDRSSVGKSADTNVTITLTDISRRHSPRSTRAPDNSAEVGELVVATLLLEIDTLTELDFSIFKSHEITTNEDEDVFIGDSFDLSVVEDYESKLEIELYALHGKVYVSARPDSSKRDDMHAIESPLKLEANDGESLQTLLSALFYSPNANFHGLDVIVCSVYGKESELAVRVIPVNDAPRIVFTNLTTFTGSSTSGKWFTFPKLLLPGLTVNDPDMSDIFDVRIDATNGSLRWHHTRAELFDGVTMSGENSATLRLKTTLERLNALLIQPQLRFIPHRGIPTTAITTATRNRLGIECIHISPLNAKGGDILKLPPAGKSLHLSKVVHVNQYFGSRNGDAEEEGVREEAVTLQIDTSTGSVVTNAVLQCADAYETKSEQLHNGTTRVVRASGVECLNAMLASAVYTSNPFDRAEHAHIHFQLYNSDLELLATESLDLHIVEDNTLPSSRFVVVANASETNLSRSTASWETSLARAKLSTFAAVEIEQVGQHLFENEDESDAANAWDDNLMDLNLTCSQCSFYHSKYIPGVSYEFAVQTGSTTRFIGLQQGLNEVLRMLEVDLPKHASQKHDLVQLTLSPYAAHSDEDKTFSSVIRSRRHVWNDTLVVPIEYTVKKSPVEWRIAETQLAFTDLEADAAVPINGVEISGGNDQNGDDDMHMELTIRVECVLGAGVVSYSEGNHRQRTYNHHCAPTETPIAMPTTRKDVNRVLASVMIAPNASSERVDLRYSVEVHDVAATPIPAPLLSIYFQMLKTDPLLILKHPDSALQGVEDQVLLLSDWVVLRSGDQAQNEDDLFVAKLRVEHGTISVQRDVCCVEVRTTHRQRGVDVLGTIGAIRNALNKMEYKGDQNFAGNDTLSATIERSEFSGGNATSSLDTSTTLLRAPIFVQPVNDPPVIRFHTPSPAWNSTMYSLEGMEIDDIDLATDSSLSSQLRVNLSSTAGSFLTDSVALNRVHLLEKSPQNDSTGAFSRLVFEATLSDANFLLRKSLYSTNGEQSRCSTGSNDLRISVNDLGHGVTGWTAFESAIDMGDFGCLGGSFKTAQLSLPEHHVLYDTVENKIAIAGPLIRGADAFTSNPAMPPSLRITGRCRFAVDLEVQRVSIIAPTQSQLLIVSIWNPNGGGSGTSISGTFTLALDLAFAGIALQQSVQIYANAVAMRTQEVLGELSNGRSLSESIEAKLMALYGAISPQLRFHVDKVVSPSSSAAAATQAAVQWKISILNSPITLRAPQVAGYSLVGAATGASLTLESAIIGAPLGGTFRLQLGDEITRDLASESSALDVQDALEALHAVEVAKVSKPDTRTWMVTFFSPGENVPLLSGDSKHLAPGKQISDADASVVLRNSTQVQVERVSAGKGQGSVLNVVVGVTRVDPVYRVITSADSSITGTFELGFQDTRDASTSQVLATTRAIACNAVAMAEDEGILKSFGGRIGDSMQSTLTLSLAALRKQMRQWSNTHVFVTRGFADAHGGYAWDITFHNAPPDFPKLVVFNSNSLRGTNSVVQLTETVGSNRVAGTFQLRYRSRTSVSIPADSSSDTVETALNDILSGGYHSTASNLGRAIVRKARIDGSRSGYSYAALFTEELSSSSFPVASNAVPRLPLAADGGRLTGIGAFARVDEVQVRVSTGSFELLAMKTAAARWSGNAKSQLFPDAFVLEGDAESLKPAIAALEYRVPKYWDGAIQFRFDLELVIAEESSSRDNLKPVAAAGQHLSDVMTSTVQLQPHTPSAEIKNTKGAFIMETTGGLPLRLDDFVIRVPGASSPMWFKLMLSCEHGGLDVTNHAASDRMGVQFAWINGTIAQIHTQLKNAVYLSQREASELDRLTLSLFSRDLKLTESVFLVRAHPPPVIPQIHIENSVEAPFTSTNWQEMDIEITQGGVLDVSGVWIVNANSASSSSDDITLEVTSAHGTLVFAHCDAYESQPSSKVSPHRASPGGSTLSLTATLHVLNQALEGLEYQCGERYRDHDTIHVLVRNEKTDPAITHERTIRLWIHPKIVIPRVVLGSVTYYSGYEDTGFQFPDLSLEFPKEELAQTTTSSPASLAVYHQLWSTELLLPAKKFQYPRAGNDDWRHRWVMDFPGRASSGVFFCELGKFFYFQGTDTIHGKELWVSDGSHAGTRMLMDLVPGPESSEPTDMIALNGKVYFAASGLDLAWTLGSDTCNGARTSSTHPDVLYMVSKSNVWDPSAVYDCPSGYHWASTEEGSRYFPAEDRQPSNNMSEPYVFWSTCQWSGYTFGGTQRRHFRFTDSKVSGAMKHAGRRDSAAVEVSFATTDFAGIVCIKSGSETAAGVGRELWSSGGSRESTVRVVDIQPGGASSSPRFLTLFKSQTLIFQADTHDFGVELFKTDGTAAGTTIVEDIWRGPRSSNPTFFVEWTAGDGRMYFAATSDSGRELWATDGFSSFTAERTRKTPGALFSGTTIVRDVCAGSGSSDPRFLMPTTLGVFFSADDCMNGRELWLTDGTATGTRLVKDLNPTPGEGSNPSYLAFYSGKLYFQAAASSIGYELYVSDGSASGTLLAADLVPGPLSSSPSFLSTLLARDTNGVAVSNALYFSASVDANGKQSLWKSDGTKSGTAPLLDEIFLHQRRLRLDASTSGTGTIFTYKNAMYYLMETSSQSSTMATNASRNEVIPYQLHVRVNTGHISSTNAILKSGSALLTPTSSISATGSFTELSQVLAGLVYYPPPNWNFQTGVGRGHVVEWGFSVAHGDQVQETYADVVIAPRPDTPVIQVPLWVEHPYRSMDDFLSKFRSSCLPIQCNEDAPVSLQGLAIRSADTGATPNAKQFALLRVSLSVSHGILTFADTKCITRVLGSPTRRQFGFEADVGCANVVLASSSYTGDPNFSGSDFLRVEVVSLESNLAAQESVPLTVLEINDSPYLVSSEFYDCDEDIPLVLQNVHVIDPDLSDSDSISVAIRAGFGSVALLRHVGVSVTPTTDTAAEVLVLQGTLRNINSALSSLVYTSAKDWNSVDSSFDDESDGFDTITFQLSDSHPFNSSSTSILYFYVRPLADPVVISIPENSPTSDRADEAGGSIHGDEDTWIHVNDLRFSSVDDMSKLTLQISLSATNGILELSTISGITFADETKDSGRRYLKFKGTFANVNKSVRALRYLPDPNFNGVDYISIAATTIDEYTMEESQETTATILVRIDAVNDPPIWDVSSAENVIVEPNSPTLIRGVHFEDGDLTESLCDTESCAMDLVIESTHGTISLPRLFEELDPKVQIILHKPGYIALAGTPEHLNFVLFDMVFELDDIEAQQEAFLDLNEVGLTLTVDDRGTFGKGGPRVTTVSMHFNLASGSTRGLSVIAPAHDVLLMKEDTSYEFDGTIKIHDADTAVSTASLLEMTVTSPNGVFSLQSVPGIQHVRNDSSIAVFRGFLHQINAALSSSSYIPDRDWYGSEQITLSVVDVSRSSRAASAVVYLAVAPVCDEPTWQSSRYNSSGAFATLDEDEKILISGLSLACPDAEADDREVAIAITANNGGVMLASYQGLLLTETQFNTPEARFLSHLSQENLITESRLFFSRLEFRGRLHDVNAALLGMIYEPNLNFHSNGNLVDEISLFATAGCGEALPSTTSFTIRLRIEAVNDPPILLSNNFAMVANHDSFEHIVGFLPSEPLEATEDVDLLLESISVQDPDQNLHSGFESDPQMLINISCIHCSIRASLPLPSLLEQHGLFITSSPMIDERSHQVIVQGCQSSINAAFLSALVFKGAADFCGTALILIQISDLGHFGKGGEKTATYAQAVVVKKINDGPQIHLPPYGTLEPLVQLDEDSSVLLVGAPSMHELSSVEPKRESSTNTGHWNLMLAQPLALESTTRLRSLGDFPGSDFSSASYFAQLRGKILFRGRSKQTGDELWESDGTAAGTTLLMDIYPGGQGSEPSHMTAYSVDSRVYFAAQGPDLSWRVHEDHRDSCQSFRQSAFDSSAFFAVAEDNIWDPDQIYDCPLGYHWMSTAEAMAVFIGTVAENGHDTEPLAYFDQCGWDGYVWGGVMRVHFRFSDSRITGAYKNIGYRDSYRIDTGFQTDSFAGIVCYRDPKDHVQIWGPELWATDGSAEGTRRVARINANIQGSDPAFFTEYKSLLFFQATSSEYGAELWVTDGSRKGTLLVADIEPGKRSSEPTFLSVFNDLLFFSASTVTLGREPWFSDGSSRTDFSSDHSHVGTGILRDICAGPRSSNPKYFTALGVAATVLLFQADDCVKGSELWRTDGTVSGTLLVSDINAGAAGSYPSYLTYYSGKVYFQADDGIHGTELWSTDGTGAGTLLLADLAPGISSSKPSFLTVLSLGQSNQIVFAAQAERDRQWEFWQSDGTLARTTKLFSGSREVAVINIDAMDAMASARFLTLSPNSFLYFGKEQREQVGSNLPLSQDSLSSTRSITLFDIESSNGDSDRDFILHLNCSKGFLSLGRDCGQLLFVRGNRSESAALTTRGSLMALNCLVERVTYHSKPDASGWDDIFVTLEESSTSGDLLDDGRVYSITKRIPVEIRAINDPPVIRMPTTYVALLDAWVDIGNVEVSDTDAGAGLVYIQLKVHNGILRLGRHAEKVVQLGRTPDSSDSVGSSLEFAATIPDAALLFQDLQYRCSMQDGCRDGMRDYLTIYVDDNGFTGGGGAQVATNSAVIHVRRGA